MILAVTKAIYAIVYIEAWKRGLNLWPRDTGAGL